MNQPLDLTIEGMTCEHCVRAVRNRLQSMDGVLVEDVQVGSAKVKHEDDIASIDDIVDAIADEGYTAFRTEG